MANDTLKFFEPSPTKPENPSCVSIGFTREDMDFQVLATLNNNDEILEDDVFISLAAALRDKLQKALSDDYKHEAVIVLNRQDAPDYVTLEEEGE